jgi:hypothetical protein
MNAHKFYNFKERVVILIGNIGELYRRIVKTVGEFGVKLAIIEVFKKVLKRVKEELKDKDFENLIIKPGVLNKNKIEKDANKIIKKFKRVYILKNGAGGNQPKSTNNQENLFMHSLIKGVRSCFNLNFIKTFIASHVFGKTFTKQGKDIITNISSISAFTPLTSVPASSTSKSVVNNFTKCIALHISQNYSNKIRLNSISPRSIFTEQNRALLIDRNTDKWTDRRNDVLNPTTTVRFDEFRDLTSTAMCSIPSVSKFFHGIFIPVYGGFSAYSSV